MSAPGLEIYVPSAVERVIDDLRGKRLGLGDVLRELARDPCSAELDARPPCCEDSIPDISEAELDDFLQRLRRVQRRR